MYARDLSTQKSASDCTHGYALTPEATAATVEDGRLGTAETAVEVLLAAVTAMGFGAAPFRSKKQGLSLASLP